jgi:hypothetical protein
VNGDQAKITRGQSQEKGFKLDHHATANLAIIIATPSRGISHFMSLVFVSAFRQPSVFHFTRAPRCEIGFRRQNSPLAFLSSPLSFSEDNVNRPLLFLNFPLFSRSLDKDVRSEDSTTLHILFI